MRIAQFTSSLLSPLGGAEQYCLALARHQRASGHDVTMITGWISDDVRAELAADGIPVVIAPSARPYSPDRQGPSLSAKLRFHGMEAVDLVRRTPATRLLENSGFDVVHVHRFAGFGTSVLRLHGPRVVHTVHDFGLVDTSASLVADGTLKSSPGLAQRVRGRLIRRALGAGTPGIDPALVFPSERTRTRHDDWGLDTSAFDSHVIPHGWASPAQDPAVHRPTPAPGAPLRVLFLGKVAAHKGIPVLMEAWGTGVDGAVLRIAGDGPLKQDVMAAAGRGIGIEDLGWLDEAQRTSALRDADVLVFPSEWPENFPIVIAESILAGLPIVTTTVASPPLVDHGSSGLVVAPTAEAIRAAIVRLADDRGVLSHLAHGAGDRAAELDMRTHGRVLERLYRRVDPAMETGPVQASDGVITR